MNLAIVVEMGTEFEHELTSIQGTLMSRRETLPPQLPIQTAILHGFGDVIGENLL